MRAGLPSGQGGVRPAGGTSDLEAGRAWSDRPAGVTAHAYRTQGRGFISKMKVNPDPSQLSDLMITGLAPKIRSVREWSDSSIQSQRPFTKRGGMI